MGLARSNGAARRMGSTANYRFSYGSRDWRLVVTERIQFVNQPLHVAGWGSAHRGLPVCGPVLLDPAVITIQEPQ